MIRIWKRDARQFEPRAYFYLTSIFASRKKKPATNAFVHTLEIAFNILLNK